MTTLSRLTEDRINTLVASVVFLFTLAVYTVTMTPTVPFWDSGEYIATSYILGVPHAPGTPLYVLLGRMFTFLPFGNIAQRVNWFSALSSAVAVLFTYLIAVKVTRKILPVSEGPVNRHLAYLSGVVGALMAAFATTFWDNAVEAEVYAPSCALMAFVIWLALRWEERGEQGNEDGLLLVITYMVGLGVGIHLGVAVAAWATVIFVFTCRPGYLARWDYLGWALVTLSLATGVHMAAFLVAPIVLVLTLGLWLLTGKLRRLAMWSAILFMLGVSVHLFLIIRSNLDPIINEAAPKTWDALWKMLIRDQYKPPPITERKADFGYQFDTMYLRYMWWNFTLFFVKGKAFYQLPILLAAAGAVVHLLRERRTGLLLGVLFMLLGPAMVVYLNFRVGEVRERDYFFVQHFMFLAIWVGVGGAWFVSWLVRQFRSLSTQQFAATAASSALVAMAVLPLGTNFHQHDRRGFYVARDYAHNMLVGLEPNAIVLTNGDNDTFPLWYIQEVENFRKDVRVVNLSLLNTDWYIKQLRDLEPKVPISFTDAQLAVMQPYRAGNGRVMMIKDQAVENIIATNKWRLPLYLAVTVPETMELDRQLVMEGLVFRIQPAPTDRRIDLEKTLENLNRRYKYEGLLVQDPTDYASEFGTYDSTVYKDENATRLVQNYAAAFSRAALALFEEGRTEESLREMDKAEAISPYFPGIALAKGVLLEELGRMDDAVAHYAKMLERYHGDWQIAVRLGQALLNDGRIEESIQYFEMARRAAPAEYYPYQGLASAYYRLNRYEDAVGVLEQLAVQHPQDANIRAYIDELRRSIRAGEVPGAGGDTAQAPNGGASTNPNGN